MRLRFASAIFAAASLRVASAMIFRRACAVLALTPLFLRFCKERGESKDGEGKAKGIAYFHKSPLNDAYTPKEYFLGK
jgi:hypothetical protein